MAKRNRLRARARRPLVAPTVADAERPAPTERERPRGFERTRARYRGAPPPSGGGHAVGDPSAVLEKAAALERAYVVKDFGRLAKVVVAMLVLLAASGFAVNTFVP